MARLGRRQPINRFNGQDLTRRLILANGFIYPNTDITTTGWTATPGASFYGMVNESSPNDSNYDTSPVIDTTQGPLIMGLDTSLAAGSWTVNLRGLYLGNGGQARGLLLDSGGSTVGTSSWQTLTASATTYNLAVTTTGTATKIRIEVQ